MQYMPVYFSILSLCFLIEQFYHWRRYTPPLFPGTDGTTGNILVKSNLNATSSRIFNPEKCLKAYCKIRFKSKA